MEVLMPVKALVVEQDVSDSVLDQMHGGGYTVKRLLIPYTINLDLEHLGLVPSPVMLAVTFHNQDVYVFPEEKPEAQTQAEKYRYRVLKEVEIADELAETAIKAFEAKQVLLGEKAQFESFM